MRSADCLTKAHEECQDLLCDCWCHNEFDEELDGEIDDDELEIEPDNE